MLNEYISCPGSLCIMLTPFLLSFSLSKHIQDKWIADVYKPVEDKGYGMDALCSWRKLMAPPPLLHTLENAPRLLDELIALSHKKYERRPLEMIRAMFSGKKVGRWARSRHDTASSQETVFCSEMVAFAYKSMGLLPQDVAASMVLPAMFSSDQFYRGNMKLTPPCYLAREIRMKKFYRYPHLPHTIKWRTAPPSHWLVDAGPQPLAVVRGKEVSIDPRAALMLEDGSNESPDSLVAMTLSNPPMVKSVQFAGGLLNGNGSFFAGSSFLTVVGSPPTLFGGRRSPFST